MTPAQNSIKNISLTKTYVDVIFDQTLRKTHNKIKLFLRQALSQDMTNVTLLPKAMQFSFEYLHVVFILMFMRTVCHHLIKS